VNVRSLIANIGDSEMGHLAKLNFKEFTRNVQTDPVLVRRDKLMAAIDEQQKVLAAALKGESYVISVTRTRKVEGENVRIEVERTVRPWFFEQDGGWYVQCKYGARPLRLSDKGNAVFKLGCIYSTVTSSPPPYVSNLSPSLNLYKFSFIL
jgi:hypothetical protein